MIHAHTQAHDYPAVIYTEMFVDKKEIRFQVDSSTSMNVIPVKFVADKKPESITKMLQMWSDTTLKPWGSCRSTLHNPKNKEKFSVVFLVVDWQLTPLIGAKAAQQMGLITLNTLTFKMAEPPERLRTEAIRVSKQLMK